LNNLTPAHLPVLLEEVLEALQCEAPVSCYADFTLGGGGHLAAFLKSQPHPKTIYAFDQDLQILNQTKLRFSKTDAIHFVHDNFSNFESTINQPIDRALVDLGVSSFQLDDPLRGFSFQKDGPLDMRMNTSKGMTAAEWISETDEKSMADAIFQYAEERRARLIARRIVAERKKRKIETTKDLVESLGFQLSSKNRQGRHPLTKLFQAIRIAVNDELGHLERFLDRIPERLSPGGRLAIISFHSIEDRIVKHRLRSRLKSVHKKVIVASPEEMKLNPRSRSAKLRIYERE